MKDDPIIRSLERTGLPPWNDGRKPRCPVCGEECETLYQLHDGEIVGCESCVETVDAWEVLGDE